MKLSPASVGLAAMALSSVSFATSGAFIKPLLEAGWSPAAAVTVRALTGGLILLPFVLVMLRGRWAALWRARWRVLGMGAIAVAFTQLAYFAAIQRIPVSTASGSMWPRIGSRWFFHRPRSFRAERCV